jgi:hypothetical protein
MRKAGRTLLMACAISVIATSLTWGQNFVLQSSVIGSGAVNGTSTNFKALGTVGQSAIGTGTSSNFKGSWGFWYTLGGGGGSVLLADVNVFLEGPYAAGSMGANILPYIPTSQPFSGSPWNYGGSESVPATDTSPSNGTPDFFDNNNTIVDWVLVQLRTGNPASPPMTVVAERAGFVKSDGSIVDLDGSSDLAFSGVPEGSYYIVIDHRNHIDAMTPSAIAAASSTVTHDFTSGSGQAYSSGGPGQKALTGGDYGLFASDGNNDGFITAPDFNEWNVATTGGATGYPIADYNMDSFVTAPDFNLWNANTTAGAASQVPNP